MHTDPVADMLARIKNANKALHDTTSMPASRMKQEIARLLKEEGYIKDFRVERGESFDTLVVEPPGLRAQGPSAARARGHGHGDHVHVRRARHEPHGAGTRRRWRGRLFHLVRSA